MNPSKTDKLYLYYQERQVLPTYARFTNKEDLDRHQLSRYNFFLEKLHLPPRIFKGAKLLEFGPDSGENSLVFASWGADVTLVEPNSNAWPKILSYFEKFGLKDKLISLAKTDLESFETTEKFQFIDAEGLISTIKPDSVWIQLFDRVLEEKGFFIISYVEAYGSLLELILKLIYTRAKNILGESSNNIAWRLFRAKWNSIPHIRSFDSWVMDMLDNPYVRLEYFFEAATLCEKLSREGFHLYSSWPNYVDSLSVYWHKKELMFKDRLEKNFKFIARSRLSFAFGKKLFLCSESEEVIKWINDILMKLVVLIDQSIDRFDRDALRKCNDYLIEIKGFLMEEAILTDSDSEKDEIFQLVESILKIFSMLLIKDIDGLIGFCNSDSAFINSWGQPGHFSVFRKEAGQ